MYIILAIVTVHIFFFNRYLLLRENNGDVSFSTQQFCQRSDESTYEPNNAQVYGHYYLS